MHSPEKSFSITFLQRLAYYRIRSREFWINWLKKVFTAFQLFLLVIYIYIYMTGEKLRRMPWMNEASIHFSQRKIVGSYLRHHTVGASELPDLITSVHRALSGVGQP